MRLIPCYKPKMVLNPYTGEYCYARCGKCNACMDSRAALWVQRLDEEMQHHRYTWFVTFQYDDQHVPQMVRLRKEDIDDKDIAYMDADTGHIISLYDDSVPYPAKKDIKYCYDTKVLLVHNYKDFQSAMKRLRYYATTKYNERIRFYSTFEYGPQTFRPHIHTLFFFSSSLLAKDFVKLLDRVWRDRNGESLGCVYDPHPVTGSASEYVASYVNSFSHLPKIYLHRDIRQKSTFSKCPPIGISKETSTDLRRLFTEEVDTLTLFRQSSSKFYDVPLWRSLVSRIYPRLQGYCSMSDTDRTKFYLLCEKLPYGKGEEDRTRLNAAYLREYIAKGFDTDLLNYYSMYFLELVKKSDGEESLRFKEDRYLFFIRTLQLFKDNSVMFGVTLKAYLARIVEFYRKKEKKDYEDFLKLQDEYFQTHSVKEYLCLFPNFYKQVNGKLFGSLKPWQQFYLREYGYTFDPMDVVQLEYNCLDCYKEMRMLHDKINFDSTKTKKSNDYLLANKDKFGNIINYYYE